MWSTNKTTRAILLFGIIVACLGIRLLDFTTLSFENNEKAYYRLMISAPFLFIGIYRMWKEAKLSKNKSI